VPPQPPGAVRVLGRPRTYKAHALLLGCALSGVAEFRLDKRTLPTEFRQLKKVGFQSRQVWECRGDRIASVSKP
jgi:hypothetical protein